jgi:Peptidase family M23
MAGLELSLPVACTIGKDCLVQKFFDHQKGDGRRDHLCGTHTTEDHDGIDIRLRTLADMRAGMAVLAAADGVVLRVRDGEPDVPVRERGAQAVAGRQAGNAIVIGHADGSETQYSHLRAASLKVKPGDRVTRGQSIALIGLSGNSDFPHLHFGLRRAGQNIDPFTGDGFNSSCAAKPEGLWDAAAARALSAPPTAVITTGFADRRITAEEARNGALDGVTLRPDRPIIFWIDAMGAKDGDIQRFDIRGPDGATLSTQATPISKGGLVWFAYHGRQPPAGGWKKGRYTARFELQRDGQTVASGSGSIEIRP